MIYKEEAYSAWKDAFRDGGFLFLKRLQNWMKHRDKSSKFFHKRVNTRQHVKNSPLVVDIKLLEDMGLIKENIIAYCKELYTEKKW